MADNPDETPTTQSQAHTEQTAILRRLNKAITSFDDLTVVDRQSIIDINSDFPLSNERSIYPDARVDHVPSESEYHVYTTATAGETTGFETVDRIRVVSGYAFEGAFSLRIPDDPTGEQDVRAGVWEAGESGAYVGLDATGPYVEMLRNGNRQGKVRPDGWNGEGTQTDVAQLLKDGCIVRIKPYLYNSGTVDVEAYESNDDGRLVSRTIHRFDPDGKSTWARQSNPLRIEVANGATAESFDVYVQDRQAARRGDFSANDRTKGDRRQGITVSDTGWEPLLSVRQKDGYDGVTVNFQSYRIAPQDDIILQVRSDSLTDPDTLPWESPKNVDASETACEWLHTDHASAFGVNAGAWRFQDIITGGGGISVNVAGRDGVDTELRRDRPVTIAAQKRTAGDTTVDVAMASVVEGW
jgi:hypothetical protein